MIAAPILIPLLAGLAAFMVRRAAPVLALAAGAATLLMCAALTRRVWQLGPQHHAVGGWDAPLGIALKADGLAVAMLLLTAVAGALISTYAAAEREAGRPSAARLFWPVWLVLWAGLNALYLSADVFNVYVLLELIGIAAVALIVQSGDAAASLAGMRYLLATMLGSLTYLFGVALLYAMHATLDMDALGALVQPNAPAVAALALMIGGLLVKTALFPLHFWLPQAHASAASPVSAILSALVVTACFYVVLRLWFGVFAAVRTPAMAQFIGALGAVAIVWGAFRALRQRRLKLLVAHSTVSQIGYLFLLVPLATPATAAYAPWIVHAWSGGIYQALSHAFAKAAMFLAAGVIVRAAGTDDLHGMRDIAGRMPVVTFALAIAGASLVGLPPTGGFVAKWLLLHAAVESGQWWWLPVFVVGGLLTATYVFLALRYMFRPAGAAPPLADVPLVVQYASLALALCALALGLRLEEPLALLGMGLTVPNLETPQ